LWSVQCCTGWYFILYYTKMSHTCYLILLNLQLSILLTLMWNYDANSCYFVRAHKTAQVTSMIQLLEYFVHLILHMLTNSPTWITCTIITLKTGKHNTVDSKLSAVMDRKAAVVVNIHWIIHNSIHRGTHILFELKILSNAFCIFMFYNRCLRCSGGFTIIKTIIHIWIRSTNEHYWK
jgi:hypothetical protein